LILYVESDEPVDLRQFVAAVEERGLFWPRGERAAARSEKGR
jgi:hypothetical protein